MRILFLDQFSEFGGAQMVLLDLLDEVARRGWRAEVAAPGDGPLHHACAERATPSHSLPLARYANGHKSVKDILRYGVDSLRAAAVVRQTGQRGRADLLYVNGPRALPAAVLATVGLKCPVIFHAHSFLDRPYSRRLARWCVKTSAMEIIAISRFVAQPFAELSGIPCSIIHNGVKDHGFVARPRAHASTIGIVGRISPEKGHLDLVRAVRTMVAARPAIRVTVYGAGLFADATYERELRDLAASAPVEFRGWTDNVAGALHEIDILAVPSGPTEGATRVIMEAFSAGTPVVAYPSGGIPEIVRDGETGILTAASNAESLAASLGELLDNPATMARLSTQGRNAWEERFRVERWQRDICNLIENTTSEFRSRTRGALYGHDEQPDLR